MVTAANSKGSRMDRKVTWLLLAGLLVLRIPFFAGARMLVGGVGPLWVDQAFEISTYLLVALLIWWKRNRLSDFHIDKLALAIVILGKPYEWLLRMLQIANVSSPPPYTHVYLLLLPPAIGLFVALRLTRTQWPRLLTNPWRWIGISVLVGLGWGALTGYLSKLLAPVGGEYPATPAFMILQFTFQVACAGINEEPVFRGFLWGALREAGWQERWIWLFQAALFTLAHVFAYARHPYFLLIIASYLAGSLALGLLAWRSRSITTSMIAHGVINGVGPIIAANLF